MPTGKKRDMPNDFQISVMWTPWKGNGLEHLTLACRLEDWLADGVIIRTKGSVGFRTRYQIHSDAHWRVRQISVDLLESGSKSISLISDGKGMLEA